MNTRDVMFTVEELYVMCMVIEGFIGDEQLLKMIEDNDDDDKAIQDAIINLLILYKLYDKFDSALTDHNYDDLDTHQFNLHKHDILTVDIVEDIEDKVLLGLLDALIINNALEEAGIEVCMNVISLLDIQDYD